MKTHFLLLFLFTSLLVGAQDVKRFTISIVKQSITVALDEDNSNKQIVLHANIKSTEKLKITNKSDEKDWKRSFEIFDEGGQSVYKVPAVNQLSYQVTVKQLRTSLKKGTYFLNTMAIPKDPALAASVRVRRMLVCKIVVN